MRTTRSRMFLLASSTFAAAFAAFAAPEVYTIEPRHTFPSFETSHRGISYWRGKFNKTGGTIVLDRERGTGSLEVIIDAGSVNFGLPIMDEVAQGETFFNVAKFPTATYRSDSITLQNGIPVAVNGKLTLLGVTKPVPLEIRSFKCMQHLLLKREVCGADARAEFNRADFGMTRDAQYDPLVRLYIQVEAIRSEAARPHGAPAR